MGKKAFMSANTLEQKQQKIIHVDMDCFYAAVEIRDNPSLADKPIAVGGTPDQRGVICTCNYIARQYGVHSAMSTAAAYRHCPALILLPVDMKKYKDVSQRIQKIFKNFTDLVEPLALDEAYLDVTHATTHQGSATLIAKAIREKIWQSEKLTASAGVAPNKFLAKIASGWNKPNGLFVIRPHEVDKFIETLPINKLHGVGKVTAKKLHHMNLQTCADLQKISLLELTRSFGKFGQRLYEQCRGQDSRAVIPNRVRKSLSVEQTFAEDLYHLDDNLHVITDLYNKLLRRLTESALKSPIKNQYIKIKYNDFKISTAEMISDEINLEKYLALFKKLHIQQTKAIRLIGLGVHFSLETQIQEYLF